MGGIVRHVFSNAENEQTICLTDIDTHKSNYRPIGIEEVRLWAKPESSYVLVYSTYSVGGSERIGDFKHKEIWSHIHTNGKYKAIISSSRQNRIDLDVTLYGVETLTEEVIPDGAIHEETYSLEKEIFNFLELNSIEYLGTKFKLSGDLANLRNQEWEGDFAGYEVVKIVASGRSNAKVLAGDQEHYYRYIGRIEDVLVTRPTWGIVLELETVWKGSKLDIERLNRYQSIILFMCEEVPFQIFDAMNEARRQRQEARKKSVESVKRLMGIGCIIILAIFFLLLWLIDNLLF